MKDIYKPLSISLPTTLNVPGASYSNLTHEHLASLHITPAHLAFIIAVKEERQLG